TRSPAASASASCGVRATSLPSKYDTTRPDGVIWRSDSNRLSRRVSSAAITSAVANSCARRGGASPTWPIGVAARTSTAPVWHPRRDGLPVAYAVARDHDRVDLGARPTAAGAGEAGVDRPPPRGARGVRLALGDR